MRQYIAKRLLGSIPVVVGVSIIVFALMRVLPGDVAFAMLGASEGRADREQLERLRAQLKLDKPIHEQYLLWAWDALHGDLGESYWTKNPITHEILRALPVTAELASLAFLMSLIIALPIGVISALRQDTWQDYVGRLFSIGFLSVPDFWTGTMFILLPLLWFHWVPPMRYVPPLKDPWENLQQFLFPALAMGLAESSTLVRMLRATLLEVLRQDYIRTAWSKGLTERVVVIRHALKNALIPVVTILGVRIGRLLGGTVVMERIFALPGVGRLVIDAIGQRDYPLVQGLVLFFAVVFVVVNLFVDLLYGWLDPRIRYA